MENAVIVVEQKPVIKYELLQQISKSVKTKIESLNIDTLEATEDNLSLVKNTRAELNKDFKELEEQRKLVKDIVLADYNKFEDEYKKLIKEQFESADIKLKSLVNKVDDEILQRKIDGLKEYFNSANKFDFITFENVFANKKIIKSTSDKSYEKDINEYLVQAEKDIYTITKLENSDRILAKYQICKELNRAIGEVNIEVERSKNQRDAKSQRRSSKAT